MGFACFSAPNTGTDPDLVKQTAEQAQLLSRLHIELAAAKKANKDLTSEVQELRTERIHLLQTQQELLDRPIPPAKADAATDMVAVAVMAKPPVEMESRIPRPTGEDVPASPDGTQEAAAASLKSPAKSRIPTYPADAASSPATTATQHSTSAQVLAVAAPMCEHAALGHPAACNSPPTAASTQPQPCGLLHTSSTDLAGNAGSAEPAVPGDPGQQTPQQRPDLLLHQLKVAEAFKQSLEAQLRDARFANCNLQTQVLSLQTKIEKTVEQQVTELEKLNKLRKEGQEARETAVKEAQQLKQQLAEALADRTAVAQQFDASVKQVVGLQHELQVVGSELKQAVEELGRCQQQLATHGLHSANLLQELKEVQLGIEETERHAQQLEAVALVATEQHEHAITMVEHELQMQKALHDTTTTELLNLTTTHTKLKQDYQQLQIDTHHREGVERLVLQEIQAQLSSRHRTAMGATTDDEDAATPRGDAEGVAVVSDPTDSLEQAIGTREQDAGGADMIGSEPDLVLDHQLVTS